MRYLFLILIACSLMVNCKKKNLFSENKRVILRSNPQHATNNQKCNDKTNQNFAISSIAEKEVKLIHDTLQNYYVSKAERSICKKYLLEVFSKHGVSGLKIAFQSLDDATRKNLGNEFPQQSAFAEAIEEGYKNGKLGTISEIMDAISPSSGNLYSAVSQFINTDIIVKGTSSSNPNWQEFTNKAFRELVAEPPSKPWDGSCQTLIATAINLAGPKQTLESLKDYDSNDYKTRIADQILGSWYFSDSVGLSKYVAQMPNDYDRDFVCSYIIRELTKEKRYDEASQWTATLPDKLRVEKEKEIQQWKVANREK